VVARVAVVVFAVAAVVFGVTHLQAAHRCDSARDFLDVALLQNRVPPGGLDAALKNLTDHCDENAPVAGAAFRIAESGERARAVALADLLIRREPDSQDGYITLAEATAPSDPRHARALKRLAVLNPRGVLPPLAQLPPLQPAR
jgi:hypothetical protein